MNRRQRCSGSRAAARVRSLPSTSPTSWISPAAALWCVVVVSAALALAASAPRSAAAAEATDRVGVQERGREGRRVVIVSDSIAAGAEAPLVSALERDGWSVTFDASQNRTTYAAAGAVSAHRAELTDTAVISLGANDGGDPATFRERVEDVLSELESVPRVFWLSLHEVRDYYVDANRILREVAADHPNLTILDWHPLASASPDLTASDGLHLSRSGADAMSDLIRTAVLRPVDEAGGTAAPEAAPTTIAPDPAAAAGNPDGRAAPLGGEPGGPAEPVDDEPEDEAGRPERAIDRADPDRLLPAAGEAPSEGGGSGWRGLLGWTLGGFLVVIAVLAAAGTGLGVWSLWTTRERAGWVEAARSPNHPAVRSQQRADRIAAARRAAEIHYGTADTQKS